ncbi:MAG: cytochrome c3 family protein [bacterium]
MAKKYIRPGTRKKMLMLGALGCAMVAIYYFADAFLLKNTFLAAGPVSANHANFESECSKCHLSFRGVVNSKCSVCHEKTNDKLGIYTFKAHYLYRSEEPQRIQEGMSKHGRDEGNCASCHPDHRGRDAKITRVLDSQCAQCHYASFNKDHPPFRTLAAADDSTLKMTHVKHTKEVLKKLNTTNIEQACLYCHNPQADGKGFKPLDFDMQCADCHLTTSSETPALTIKDGGASPGVETLEMIQRRRGPGTIWAFYTNPNEFSVSNGKVKKSPVYHRDPWVLENLKQIFRTLYSDSSLADLLNATGNGVKKGKQQIYAEAIQKLRDYVTGLRSRPEPEVQAELMRIDSLLNAAENKIMRGGEILPDLLPMMKIFAGNSSITQEQRTDLEDFAQKLTRPCQECHVVEHASILSVKASQRTFQRAEFDHRAHITQRRCLECHNVIPVEQALAGDTTGVAMIDRASTHNIPGIQNCYECHTKDAGSNSCVTCHYMHPNKANRGSLQLFVSKQ